MPFERATLTQLRDAAAQDAAVQQIYDSRTGQLASVSMFVHSPLAVMAFMTAAAVYSGYGYLDWIAEQSTPWGATGEKAAGWGALKSKTQKSATPATGSETVFGPAQTDIPAGSVLARADGVTYTTDADVTIGTSLSAVIAFTAADTGSAGNAAIGTALTFQRPPAGVAAGLVTANVIAGGDEIETADDFKARYLAAYAAPPAGGSQTDYPAWALDVPGVTRAWCNPNGAGGGTVVVYTMWDVADAAWGGFPQGSDGVATAETRDAAGQGDQLAVADAIYPLRPVTALVYSCAPVPQAIDFVLANLGSAATAATQAAVAAALTALFLDVGSPLGVTHYPSAWEAALAAVPALTQYTLVSPIGPVVVPVGHLAVLGAVTLSA